MSESLNNKEIRMSFSKHLFWDVDLEQFSLDTCPSQVITRILEYGEMQDWLLIRNYYGIDKIVEELKTVRSLDSRALSYICCISGAKKEDFRCYHTAQSNRTLWNS